MSLPWAAVDLKRAELDLGLQLQRVRGQLLHRATNSEASDATLPLPGICVTALRMRETEQSAARLAAGDSWAETGLVFTTRVGTRFEPRNFNRRFEVTAAVLCRCTGTKKATCQDRKWPLTCVGVAGFEPAASSSRTKRAAKLRHTPLTAREV